MKLARMNSRVELQGSFEAVNHQFLGRALSWLRWSILAAMLLITLMWPVQGRTGHLIWQFVLFLIGYNLLLEILRHRVPWLRTFTWFVIFDLFIAVLVYFLDAEPCVPTFIVFCLDTISAAATMTLRGTILYTIAVIFVVLIVAP